MSGIEYDAEALNEAFYNDPASVIAAASAEAAAQAAANVAQSLHQQNLQAELAKTAGEVEQIMQSGSATSGTPGASRLRLLPASTTRSRTARRRP